MSNAPRTVVLDLTKSRSRDTQQAPQSRAYRAPEARADVELGLHKPEWSQGLRLFPHHFQQATRYLENFHTLSLRAAVDQPWGVVDLDFDEHALSAGRVDVKHLVALFEDGTPIVVGPSGNAKLPAASFEAELREPGAELELFVGLRLEQTDEAQVTGTSDASPQEARFTAVQSEVADFNTGRRPIDVPWLRANLRLLTQPSEGFTTLRIAHLRRSETGRIEMVRDFAPPSLRLHASPVLLHAVANTLASVRAAADALQTQQGPERTPETARLLALSTLGQYVPLLEGALASGSTGTREAFNLLSEIVGCLSAYAPTGTARLPPYNHHDPGPGFDALAAEAHRVLSWVGAPPFKKLALTRTNEEGVWVAHLSEPGAFKRPFLLVVSGADPAMLHERLPQLTRVAAPDELGALIRASVPGIRLVPEARKLHGLPVPARSACFRFDTREALWQRVVGAAALAIALPTFQHEPLELSLFADLGG